MVNYLSCLKSPPLTYYIFLGEQTASHNNVVKKIQNMGKGVYMHSILKIHHLFHENLIQMKLFFLLLRAVTSAVGGFPVPSCVDCNP